MAMVFGARRTHEGVPDPLDGVGILPKDAANDEGERDIFAEAEGLIEENRRLIEESRRTVERARRATGQLTDGRQDS